MAVTIMIWATVLLRTPVFGFEFIVFVVARVSSGRVEGFWTTMK